MLVDVLLLLLLSIALVFLTICSTNYSSFSIIGVEFSWLTILEVSTFSYVTPIVVSLGLLPSPAYKSVADSLEIFNFLLYINRRIPNVNSAMTESTAFPSSALLIVILSLAPVVSENS